LIPDGVTGIFFHFLPHYGAGVDLASNRNEFIHSVVCLATGLKPLPKRALLIARSRASTFKWEYPLLSLRSFSSFLRLLPRLPVTSIFPFIFSSETSTRNISWGIKVANA